MPVLTPYMTGDAMFSWLLLSGIKCYYEKTHFIDSHIVFFGGMQEGCYPDEQW